MALVGTMGRGYKKSSKFLTMSFFSDICILYTVEFRRLGQCFLDWAIAVVGEADRELKCVTLTYHSRGPIYETLAQSTKSPGRTHLQAISWTKGRSFLNPGVKRITSCCPLLRVMALTLNSVRPAIHGNRECNKPMSSMS